MRAYDPRTKLVVVMILSTFGVFINDLLPMVLLGAGTMMMALYFNSPVLKAFYRIRKLVGVLVAMVFIQSIFTSGGAPLIAIGDFTLLSTRGLYYGSIISLRFIIIILSATILLTSNSRDLVQGLYQWKIPYELAFMVSLAIRFLPLLKEEALDMYTAIQLRGVEFEKLSFRKKITVFSYLLMPMIAGVLNKAKELSIAVEMRAFRATPLRTSHRSLKLCRRDYILMFSMGFLGLIAIMILRI